MRPVLLFLLGSIPVFAQPFSAGIKAGVPLTDPLDATQNPLFEYNAPTQRYIIGGMAEVRLPLGLGVEFDALYRNLQYSSGPSSSISISASGSNWEFPLLLKYRFHFPVVRPYVDGGVAWDTITGLKETLDQVAASPGLLRNTTMGYVVGAGVDIHAIFLHISPELRYARWSSPQISEVQSGVTELQTNQNQLEFLVGITF